MNTNPYKIGSFDLMYLLSRCLTYSALILGAKPRLFRGVRDLALTSGTLQAATRVRDTLACLN